MVVEGSFSEDLLINTIKEFWPKAVVDNVQDELSSHKHEIFGYSTNDSKMVWDEHGLTDEFADEMIYIILEKDHICLVVNSPESKIGKHIVATLGKENGK